jgi:hypothetical protein
MKNWRQHLRLVAIIANVLLVMFLIGTKGWWMSKGWAVLFRRTPVTSPHPSILRELGLRPT